MSYINNFLDFINESDSDSTLYEYVSPSQMIKLIETHTSMELDESEINKLFDILNTKLKSNKVVFISSVEKLKPITSYGDKYSGTCFVVKSVKGRPGYKSQECFRVYVNKYSDEWYSIHYDDLMIKCDTFNGLLYLFNYRIPTWISKNANR